MVTSEVCEDTATMEAKHGAGGAVGRDQPAGLGNPRMELLSQRTVYILENKEVQGGAGQSRATASHHTQKQS